MCHWKRQWCQNWVSPIKVIRLFYDHLTMNRSENVSKKTFMLANSLGSVPDYSLLITTFCNNNVVWIFHFYRIRLLPVLYSTTKLVMALITSSPFSDNYDGFIISLYFLTFTRSQVALRATRCSFVEGVDHDWWVDQQVIS